MIKHAALGLLLMLGPAWPLAACAADAADIGAPSVQVDFFADAHYSRHNFTDLSPTYRENDAFAVLKGAYWLDAGRNFGPYAEVIGSHSSADMFWWQRYAQGGLGLQWHPLRVPGSGAGVYGLRLFVLALGRETRERPANAIEPRSDVHAGFDYYGDTPNLDLPLGVEPGQVSGAYSLFANGAWRRTNFAAADYRAFTLFGNAKAGALWRARPTALYAYGLVDWNYSPHYPARWWENHLRAGIGARWYPLASSDARAGGHHPAGMLRRVHLYVESVRHIASLGETMPPSVRRNDLRIGVAIFTDGFSR